MSFQCESTNNAAAKKKKKETQGPLSLAITGFSDEFKERGARIQQTAE